MATLTEQKLHSIGDYKVDLLNSIGRGAYGDVYCGEDKHGKIVAAKNVCYMKNDSIQEKTFNVGMNELAIFRRLEGHNNILKLLFYFDDGKSHWLIMEFGDLGDLKEYLKKKDVSRNMKLKIMYECASAVSFMHSFVPPIVHRDIKPTNVLMMRQGNQDVVKLTDFGLGKIYQPSSDNIKLTLSSNVGTYSFMAPEFYMCENQTALKYYPSVDIFALGLLYHVLLFYSKENASLEPCSETMRGTNMYIHFGLEMVHANKMGALMPVPFTPAVERDCVVVQLQKIIADMILFEESERLKPSVVKDKLMDIYSNLLWEENSSLKKMIELPEISVQTMEKEHTSREIELNKQLVIREKELQDLNQQHEKEATLRKMLLQKQLKEMERLIQAKDEELLELSSCVKRSTEYDKETVPELVESSGYTNTTTSHHSSTKPKSGDSSSYQRFGLFLKRQLVGEPGEESAVRDDNTKTINGITVYQLPLHETHRDNTNRIRKVRIGQTIDSSPQKTILLVGARGSGKSTMIDGMINYIYGMTWEDNHRLTLVKLQDDEKVTISKSASQTEWITAYTIPKSEFSEIPYTVTIVDMPGFGDTRGVQRDKELVGQLKKLFDCGIDSVNSVGFIAKAGDARLTPVQRYIFDQILSLFGNDMKENIQVLITFVDGKPPVVMEALKSAEVPFTKTFKFNNSALFSSIGSDDQKQPGGDPFTKLFWDMGMKSYAEFFQYLSHVPERSLTLTAKVLKRRDELNVIIQTLQKKIESAVVKINHQDQLEKKLEENEEAMQTIQKYEMFTLKDGVEKVPMKPGEYSTHCTTCNYTCHENCHQTCSEDLKECSAMDKKTGQCIACPQKCQWSKHIRENYYFKPTVIRVHITKEDVSKQAVEGKKGLEGLLEPIRRERKKLEDEVKKMVAEVTECMQKLDKIALKKGELSEVDYFELLIENENEKQKCQERINMYNSLIKEAKIRRKVRRGEVDKLMKK